jgi:hypothetical protein
MIENGQNEYMMQLSLNVLNHLGINLYSNISSVLSEVVANAWDADAEKVDIQINDDYVVISDDGHGMSIDDANKKFLMVGYRRREQDVAITGRFKRPVMGRKGIGKLSLFSIANHIKVFSVKNNERHGFEMRLDEIKRKIESGEGVYYPKKLDDFPDDLDKGTRIIISGFKRNFRQPEKNLKRRLARRFSVVGAEYNFQILLNGQQINPLDRDYYHKVQFLWVYGKDDGRYNGLCRNSENVEVRASALEISNYSVKGWIGTVREAGDLKDTDTGDNLNKIVVMVRGKVAQEDILGDFIEGGIYSKYVFGELEADFLDSDNEDDIATSSRQNIIEDDARYVDLKNFLEKELKYIQSNWTELRNKEGEKMALEIPAIKDWYKTLGSDNKKKAVSLFGKINKLTLASEVERKGLLKHGILAFESLRVKENLDALENLDGSELDKFIRIFRDIDDIEATFYRQIVVSRIGVIRSLKEKVDMNVREKILQEHIYDHLWLLDPGWERVDASEYMEQQVLTEFGKIEVKLSDDERNGRVDIKYRTTSGKHLIIELKRAERILSTFQLMEQVDKYKKALRKILDIQQKSHEPIEVICVVGRSLSDWGDNPIYREESVASMEKQQIRVVLYQELICNAEKSYEAYLKKKKEAGRIYDLIQQIDVEW